MHLEKDTLRNSFPQICVVTGNKYVQKRVLTWSKLLTFSITEVVCPYVTADFTNW